MAASADHKGEMMARGRWTRWGRGSCEGYSLEFGGLIHFSVVRHSGIGPAPDYFELTSHTRRIDSFPTARDGMAYAEQELESGMQAVLHDWAIYQQNKAKSRKP
ncbi:MAG: hypothetical protein AB7F09_06540 [Parvibaculaceae bacterium]